MLAMKILTAILLSVLFSCNSEESNVKRKVKDHITARISDPKSLEVHNWKIEKDGRVAYYVLVDYGYSNGIGAVQRSTKKFHIIGDGVYEQSITMQELNFYK